MLRLIFPKIHQMNRGSNIGTVRASYSRGQRAQGGGGQRAQGGMSNEGARARHHDICMTSVKVSMSKFDQESHKLLCYNRVGVPINFHRVCSSIIRRN